MHALEQLEGTINQMEAAYAVGPDRTRYADWHHALRELTVFRLEQTRQTLLTTAQRVFE